MPRHRQTALVAALAAALASTPARPSSAAAGIRARGVPWIHTFGTDQGIPQSTIEAIAFDAAGRLWIGTQAGPAFYDGRRFTPLTLPPPQTAIAAVRAIGATRDGAVWLGMSTGHILRYEGGAFARFGPEEGLTAEREVTALVEMPLGRGFALWAATLDGLYRLEGARWARVDLGPAHPDVRALAPGTLPSDEPTLWVGTGQGLFHCEDRRCAPFESLAEGPPDKVINALLETFDERRRPVLWAGTYKGVARFADRRWELVAPSGSALPGQVIRALAETVSGSGKPTLWVGTDGGGLARLQDGVWTTLTRKTSGLPDDYVKSLLATPRAHGGHTLWIGTETGGLGRLRHDGWVGFTERSAGVPGSVVGVAEVSEPGRQPAIWIALSNELYRSSDEGFAPVLPPEAAAEMSSRLAFLLPSRREPGVVWTGGFNRGLHRWAGGQLTTFTRHNSALPFEVVYAASESLDGTALWVGTTYGAARLDAGGKGPVYLAVESGLLHNHVTATLETARRDGRTSAWLGTTRGLSRLEDGTWTSYTAATSPLGSDVIMTLAELRDARGARLLWVGTQGGGVARYDLDAEGWLPTLDATSSPALPDSNVYSVRADALGRVYLGTNRGVARLTPRSPAPDDAAELSVDVFTREDGLPSDECNSSASWVDSRGRIWVGMTGGAAVFDPAEEVDDIAPRPLLLSAALATGGELLPGAALSWEQNTVAFDFALLSFFREPEIRYKVRLLGFEPSPGAWSADARVRYTNLPAGAYTFQVWGRDHAGKVAGPVSLAFQVKPAPWRTWWAYLGYALGLAGLVWGGGRVRLRALARRSLALQRQVEERTAELDVARQAAEAANRAKSSFLANMSHDLRGPLHGILGHAQRLARSPRLSRDDLASLGVVQRSGEHLLALIDDLLDLARIEAGKLELAPAEIHLPSLLQGVADLCRLRAEEKGVLFRYVPAPGAPAWLLADEKRLTQVLLNLLGNAIKFTREGSVTLRVEAQAGEEGAAAPSPEPRAVDFVFRVEDTGAGIAPADLAAIFDTFKRGAALKQLAEGFGLGLAICRRIVGQMGGRIDVESAPGKGSTFAVALRLPVVAGRSTARPAEARSGDEGARQAAAVVETPEGPAAAPGIEPPAEVIARFLDLAERGRIPELVRELEAIEAEDARLAAWAGEVRALAEAYRLRELCDKLAPG